MKPPDNIYGAASDNISPAEKQKSRKIRLPILRVILKVQIALRKCDSKTDIIPYCRQGPRLCPTSARIPFRIATPPRQGLTQNLLFTKRTSINMYVAYHIKTIKSTTILIRIPESEKIRGIFRKTVNAHAFYNLFLIILPLVVLGSDSRNSTILGYL